MFGPRDVVPIEHSGFDRTINLIVTVVPFGLLALAMWLAWGGVLGWPDLLVLAIMYTATAFGITVGFHRLFTHRSFKTGRCSAVSVLRPSRDR